MTYEEAQMALVATAKVLELYGPSGFCPVQAWGKLTTGEEFFFRARGTKASLEISLNFETLWHTSEVVDVFPQAGYLSPERCVQLFLEWLSRYEDSRTDIERDSVTALVRDRASRDRARQELILAEEQVTSAVELLNEIYRDKRASISLARTLETAGDNSEDAENASFLRSYADWLEDETWRVNNRDYHGALFQSCEAESVFLTQRTNAKISDRRAWRLHQRWRA